ncbi:MAG: hypothetical protein ACRDI0_08340 [Actinomycetota bacterium]
MSGPRRRISALSGLLVALVALGGRPAMAQGAEPTVRGSVSGTLVGGTSVTLTVIATHPQGWAALREVDVVLTLKDVPLDELKLDADDQAVSTGGSRALLGTGDVATGRFFRLSALDVTLTTAGKRLTVTMRPHVIADVPPGARFEFVAQDDFGDSVSVGRVAPTEPHEGGIPWGTAALAVAGALAAGGLVGSRVAAHRRPARSIYATVHRKIEAQPYRAIAATTVPEAAAAAARTPAPADGPPSKRATPASSPRKRTASPKARGTPKRKASARSAGASPKPTGGGAKARGSSTRSGSARSRPRPRPKRSRDTS